MSSEIGIDFYYRGVHHVLLTHSLVRFTSFVDVSTLTSPHYFCSGYLDDYSLKSNRRIANKT